MPKKDKDAKSCVTTVRFNKKEDKQLDDLRKFFGNTKSEVLADGMYMIRDLKQVIQELIVEQPELANVLKDNLIPSLFNAKIRHEEVGKVAEKVLVGLMKKDIVNAGRRAQLVLKLFEPEKRNKSKPSMT